MGETWVLAFRFAAPDQAKAGWRRVRDAILFEDLDASVYRSYISGEWHVVVVGNQCLDPKLHNRFAEACSGGSSALIPDKVAAYLVERRERAAIPGMFWERRSIS